MVDCERCWIRWWNTKWMLSWVVINRRIGIRLCIRLLHSSGVVMTKLDI